MQGMNDINIGKTFIHELRVFSDYRVSTSALPAYVFRRYAASCFSQQQYDAFLQRILPHIFPSYLASGAATLCPELYHVFVCAAFFLFSFLCFVFIYLCCICLFVLAFWLVFVLLNQHGNKHLLNCIVWNFCHFFVLRSSYSLYYSAYWLPWLCLRASTQYFNVNTAIVSPVRSVPFPFTEFRIYYSLIDASFFG
jgi:hypothetical protein